ncbi:MAG TPA: ABC transporter ATP-binding protein [Victivallales bacterium]|nr:ABC transporter ATP-binding protein [Victivallales bacterium]HPO90917.1 ABC transporter ATP-binding protein [Victivallales bacterium]HRR27985.1 ABC transporter ATP-binding protein [Victivallales bacterium]HRU02114.1 ABC transporter ATP-binding protein [Victivallales bacterium]
MNDSSKNNFAISAYGIKKNYKLGTTIIEVLRGIDLEIEKGLWCALLGSSGSGKTTLLNIIAGIEKPDSGELLIDGQNTVNRTKRELNEFRRRHIGIIFQAYYLIPELNTTENVMLPAIINGIKKKEARKMAEELLELVGLKNRLKHNPLELSGGEQQRAAIARALINKPSLLLADEPTGNLDSKTGEQIIATISSLRREGIIRNILMVTHNPELASMADKIISLKDGKIVN